MIMREIKFRAWDKNKKQWYSPEFCAEGHSLVFDEKTFGFLNGDLIFMQYTGLKDKNGKEIYCGDILRATRKPQSDYKGPPSIVKWDEEGAHFHIFRGDTPSGYTLKGEVKLKEIIGNIYENPELLDQTKENKDLR